MKLHTALALLTLTSASAPVLAQAPPPVSPAPVVKLEYDAQGNPTRTVLAPNVPGLGLSTSHSYDRLHRRRDTTDARAGVTRLDYNGREDVTQVSDPRNLLTQYPRNGLGDSTGLVSPDTGTATHTYDAAGNLKTRLDSRGALATHSYDVLNRLTATTYTQAGQPSRLFTWTFDQTGSSFSYGVGRLTSASFPGGNSTYRYDPQGRLTQTSQLLETEALVIRSTAYSYDAAGHVVSITYPSGRVLYIPHSGGLPSSLSLADNASAAAAPLISQLQYEPFGAVRAWQWQFSGGPLWHERVFDSSARMVRYPLGGALRDISYDAADRISAYTHLDRNTGTATAAATALNQSFAYDELGRLVQVNTSTGNATYAYDASGNRLLTTGSSGPRNHIIDLTSNRLLALDNPARSLGHDAAGNTVDDWQGAKAWTAVYDAAGRQASVRSSQDGYLFTTVVYRYNSARQRVLKQPTLFQNCSSATSCKGQQPIYNGGVVYVYDQQGQLLGEYDAQNGQPLREYIWLQGMPLAVIAHDMVIASRVPIFYLHTDHLNTPRVALDGNGAQRWSWVSEPFGNAGPVTNPVGLGEFTLNLRMPGQYFDWETGLSQNWHRDYDAGTGRYTQSDPIGLQGGINTYTYVGGNPISRVDPYGLQSITIEGYAGVGGGVTIGRDPNTGQPFMSLRAGWGLGGGFKWDKNGGRPGSEGLTNACKDNGAGIGLFGDIDFNAGPLQAGLKNNFGQNSGTGYYGQFMSPGWSLGDSWGYKLGGSAGVEFTFWTPDVRPGR